MGTGKQHKKVFKPSDLRSPFAGAKKRKNHQQVQYDLNEFAEFLLDVYEEVQETTQPTPLRIGSISPSGKEHGKK